MKKRLMFALSLGLIAGLIAPIQPASAGLFVKKLHIACKVKVAGALTYPTLGGKNFTIAVNCGKGKPKKHPLPPDSPLRNLSYCQADSWSINGKKPTKTKPLRTTHKNPPSGTDLRPKKESNCNIVANGNGTDILGLGVGGNCGQSSGSGTATISTPNIPSSKVVTIPFSWAGPGGTLVITGTAANKGVNQAAGVVVATPDVLQKGASCLTGATQFKIIGTLILAGIKSK